MILRELLTEFEKTLSDASFESPSAEASIIASDLLDVSLMELRLQGARRLSSVEERELRAALARRLAHEPLQYISGVAYFRSLKLAVGPGCLIPRPETETLAELVLKALPPKGCVCDVGAGSGALGLALASERPDASVFASEISPEAFAWAERNMKALAPSNYKLALGDMLDPFRGTLFDAIVANLPYIPSGVMRSLPQDVVGHEPAQALDGGPDGLDLVRRLVISCESFMKPGALIALEIGEEQGAAALSVFGRSGFFESAAIQKDLFGKERFAIARRR